VILIAGEQVAAVMVGQGCSEGRVHGHCLLLSGGTRPGISRLSPSRLLSTAQPGQRTDYPFRVPAAEGVKLPTADFLPGNPMGLGQVILQSAASAELPFSPVNPARGSLSPRDGGCLAGQHETVPILFRFMSSIPYRRVTDVSGHRPTVFSKMAGLATGCGPGSATRRRL
jgi:hypothetical protein